MSSPILKLYFDPQKTKNLKIMSPLFYANHRSNMKAPIFSLKNKIELLENYNILIRKVLYPNRNFFFCNAQESKGRKLLHTSKWPPSCITERAKVHEFSASPEDLVTYRRPDSWANLCPPQNGKFLDLFLKTDLKYVSPFPPRYKI